MQKTKIMNKSLTTNLIALFLAISGYFSPIYGEIIFMIGIFALSGSLTNWIAIHMLFERVPFLYGSGVIPNRFEDFKIGIKSLIVEEFFNKKHIEEFFKQNGGVLSASSINDKIDFDKVFEGLKDAIIESPMGSMLSMFGGKEALDPLKEPIIEKLKNIVGDLANNKDDNSADESKDDFTQNLIEKIEQIIDKRLVDLTPKMVKDIIQKMIKQHLGWLVVWGGVFGGLIGLVFSIIS
ncbi:MAG: uncharacterized membrane-anchored protein YjiN (DUF445 family) [Myxococcota bacterium]|jgi:uncharacterized membrane-anchored protein YjiN (DUF445 family)